MTGPLAPSDEAMPTVSLETTCTPNVDTVFRELDGEAVLLDLNSGTYFGLNAVGTRIWHLLGARGPLAAVLDALCQEYDADRDVIERDLLDLVGRLADARLISVQ